MEIVDLLEYGERAQLREWFERNAASKKCCWIAMYRGKKKPEGVCLPYIDVVEESLCFGWIDSTLKRLGDGRLAQRLSPRQKRSHWTELNKQRCADLEARGLMTDLGRAALMVNNKRNDTMKIDTTNMCSHLQWKLFEGEYRAIREQIESDPTLTVVVRSRQLHIYRDGKKILVLAGKSALKIIREDKLNQWI